MQINSSVPKSPPSETKVSNAVASGLLRASQTCGGKGTLADKMEVHTKTVERAMVGDTVPNVRNLFNSLLADPTSLDELADLYGVVIRPKSSQAANDLHTAACMATAAGSFMEALSDGRRDHNETIALADLFRPLLKMLGAVVEEADTIRGAA